MEKNNADSTAQIFNVLQAKDCCISAASDSTSKTCKAIFELWCGFYRIILCQTRISKSKIQVKFYIAIFIDPAVKAVHLELVSNLSHVPLLLSLEGLLHEGGIV